MLKRALTAVPAVVLLLGLAACGSEDDADDGASEETTSAQASPSETTESEATEATESEDTDPGDADQGPCEYVPDGTEASVQPPPASPAVSGEVTATVQTSVGDLEFILDGDRTACTTNSFVSLAEQGYFDGTSCHRLTTAGIYVLQCGDPTGTGAGGPGYSFADELSGEETYGAGTLAMANAGPNTNGSQFFIVYGDSQLPAAYTVFGQVSPDAVAIVAGVAQDGSDGANGTGDGAPNTPVEITGVTVQ